MSREWGEYDGDNPEGRYALWQQTVKLALTGKRGQKALRELAVVLDAMPEKRLIEGRICRGPDEWGDGGDVEFSPMLSRPIVGEVCALGAWARARGIPDDKLMDDAFTGEYEGSDLDTMGAFGQSVLGLTYALAATVAEVNDERWRETPEQRWGRVRSWVAGLLAPAPEVRP